jgi:hypothetical protein
MLVFPFSLMLGLFTTNLAPRSVFFRSIHPGHYYYAYHSSRSGSFGGGGYRGGGPGIGK